MSYHKDKDAHTRGVGAIAARDSANPRRTMSKRMRRALATERRDARMAGLGEALGAINIGGFAAYRNAHATFGVTNPVGGGNPTGCAIDGGGCMPGGGFGYGPGGLLGHGGPGGGRPVINLGKNKLVGSQVLFPKPGLPHVPPPGGWGFPIPGRIAPGNPVLTPPQTSGGIPVPTDSSGASGSGGGGSGGGSAGGGGGIIDPIDPTDVPAVPDGDIFSKIPGGKVTVLVGAAALAYLIFKKRGR